MSTSMLMPLCNVRGCALPLSRHERQFRCPAGHAFDIARGGHVNLLQPQDRKAEKPGDSAEAVAARGRALLAGVGDELGRAACELVEAHAPAGRLSVLDVGCGDGFFLRALGARREIEACGLDLSTPAAQAAVRACPQALIVIANADRGLPLPGAAFDVALSITARRPVAELQRVLKPGGLLVVAVPAEDDLIELREEVLGMGERRDRVAALREELGPCFTEVAHLTARARMRLDAPALQDVLASTYRGARASQQDRVKALGDLEVTVAHELLALRPRSAGP